MKKTNWAVIISVIAAVVSAVVLVIVFWDKIMEKFPCCCRADFEPMEDEGIDEEEFADFADVDAE